MALARFHGGEALPPPSQISPDTSRVRISRHLLRNPWLSDR